MDEGTPSPSDIMRGDPGAIAALHMAPRELRVVEGDLGVREDIERAFVKYPVDVVIHFAAIAYVSESMADPTATTTSPATPIVLETMQKFGVKPRNSSTCATYGSNDVLPITKRPHGPHQSLR